MKWYIQKDRKVAGPFEQDLVVRFKQLKWIDWSTLCCPENSTDWQPFSEIKALCRSLEQQWIVMENLPSALIVADDKKSLIGEMETSEIYSQIQSGKLPLTYSVWAYGWSEWLPIYRMKSLLYNPKLGLDQEIIWTNPTSFD